MHEVHTLENNLLPRRSFLRTATASVPLFYGTAATIGLAQDEATPSGQIDGPFRGVITRQKDPDNIEFPFFTLNSFLTPNEQFYIRSHFPVPEIKANEWKLSVEGHVERPFEIGYDELGGLAQKSLTALLECSGNSRVFLKPPQRGIRWEQGGVSNGEWSGVSLSTLLERAGVKAGAVEVILEGQDQGKIDDPKTPGDIPFARSLPFKKAMQPEVLLATKMNGEVLPRAHGFPVRAVVAGWYGMASVKWLRKVIVTEQPFNGYFQTFAYTIWQRQHGGLPSLVPVTEVEVKAQIARPALHEVVRANSTCRIFGAAWSGSSEVEQVDVSTDSGSSWAPAKLDTKSLPFSWRFFEYKWQTPKKPGQYVLMARAKDRRGRVQPMARDDDRRDAVINHVQPIQIAVK